MNEFMFNDGTPDGVQPVVETPPTPPVEPQVNEKELRLQIQRELSKELGVNLFEAEGLKQVKELIDTQKTEQQKLQEQLNAYKEKEAEWTSKQLEYDAKMKAVELGIASEYLEDALKLADNNPDNLKTVLEKYPTFRSGEGIQIGVQKTHTPPPSGKTEIEKYMAENPRIYKR